MHLSFNLGYSKKIQWSKFIVLIYHTITKCSILSSSYIYIKHNWSVHSTSTFAPSSGYFEIKWGYSVQQISVFKLKSVVRITNQGEKNKTFTSERAELKISYNSCDVYVGMEWYMT